MIELVRLVLLLAIAGAAVTFLGSAWSWWTDEDRRLRRLLRKVLGGAPDAAITSPGQAAAAGFRLLSGRLAVMRDGGARTLLYRVEALTGAEVIADDQVAARVTRTEPRRALDQVDGEARQVGLRLMFDDPRHPDFVLELWGPADARQAHGQMAHGRTASTAIREARAWLARVEALLKRTGGQRADGERAPVSARTPIAPAEDAPAFDPPDSTPQDFAIPDISDTPPPKPAAPPPRARPATPSPAPLFEALEEDDERPPWDEAPARSDADVLH